MRPLYCGMPVHVIEQQMVEITGALHYGVSHDHIMLLGRKTPDIIIVINPVCHGGLTQFATATLFVHELKYF